MGNAAEHPAAAFGPTGTVWVAFHDLTFRGLVVSELEADRLVRPVRVDDGGTGVDVGHEPALAIAAGGEPVVAYVTDAGGLRLATRHDGDWSVASWEGHFARRPTIAADSLGGVHVGFRREGARALGLLSVSEGGCRALGQVDGAPHEPRIVTADDMALAGMASSDFGDFPSIAIAASGALVASFYDRARGNLVLATCAGEALDLRVLDGEDLKTGRDTGDVGLYSSLAVDPTSGKVGVAYFDRTRGVLKYATSTQGQLTVTLVDDGRSASGAFTRYVGQGATLAFGFPDGAPSGLPRVAYIDASERTLRLAALDAFDTWSSVVVQDGVSDPNALSVGFGANDQAVAVFTTLEGEAPFQAARCTGLTCAE